MSQDGGQWTLEDPEHGMARAGGRRGPLGARRSASWARGHVWLSPFRGVFPGWSGRGPGRDGQGPEALQGGLELTAEMQGVQALIHRLELLPTKGGEHARRTETLIRGAGAIIHAMHARAAALFADELLDRLEEVDMQAGEIVDAGELGIGGLGRRSDHSR